MESRPFKKYLLPFLLLALVVYGAYSFGRQGYDLEFNGAVPTVKILNDKPIDSSVDFSLFWKAYELLNQKYITSPLEPKKLLYGALHGLYAATGDPYTLFLSPDENKDVNSSLNGKYEGIGAELGMREGQLIVVAPLDGSPAKSAGIKVGDAITKIDGKDTSGISLAEAVNKIRGPADSKVVLTIRHVLMSAPNEASSSAKFSPAQDISLVRAAIKVESIKWEIKENNVAYVRVSRFGETTDEEWDKMVSAVEGQKSKVRALVLDLRSNPGGFFESAIHLASEFIPDGVISYQSYTHDVRQEYKVDHPGRFLKLPAIVLINEGSASASEIVAGALRDRRGFKIIGVKSFGKGTVQDAENFDDGSGVHITVAKWLTPNGYNIHGSGINPDVKVEITDEEINNGKDLQLDKALEIANKF